MRLAALLILLVVAGSSAGAAEPPPPGFDDSRAGRAAPEIAFLDAAGAPHRLSEFKGQPVLVVFWATWCAACIAELPGLAKLQAEGRGGLQVVTIAQDGGGAAVAQRFLRRQGISVLPAFADSQRRLGTAFGQAWLPTAILLDAAGNEVVRSVGNTDWGAATALQRWLH